MKNPWSVLEMVNPLAGVLIGARYRLIGELGSGKSGIVWDARDEQLDLPVAMKELRPPEPGSPEQLAELMGLLTAEARYTGELTHANIVAVYDVVSDFDRAWVIMPKVSGRCLATEIEAGGAWEPARAAWLGLQLLGALEAAHGQGVAHGAIKPSNVLVADFGGPLLTDFSFTPAPMEGDLLDLGKVINFAVHGSVTRSSEPSPNAGLIAEVLEGLLTPDPARRLTLPQARAQLTTALAALAEQRKRAQSIPDLDHPAAAPALIGDAPAPYPGHAADADAPISTEPAGHPAAPAPSATHTPPALPATPTLAAATLGTTSAATVLPAALPPIAVVLSYRPPTATPDTSRATEAAQASGHVPAIGQTAVSGFPARTQQSAGSEGELENAGRAVEASATGQLPANLPGSFGNLSYSGHEAESRQAGEGACDRAELVAATVRGHAAPRSSRRRTTVVTLVTVAVIALGGAAFALLRAPGTEGALARPTASGPAAPDTTAPQQPVNVTVSGRSTDTVTLVWDAGIDNVGVTEYRVQRDGNQVGTSRTPDYTDTGLAVDTAYTYTVTAVDAAGNVSAASTPVSATTLKAPDTTKPSAPGNLRVTGRSTNSITLGWAAATDDVGVARYEVRRDGKLVAAVTAPHHTDTGLTASTSHTYTVVAIDATGNVSDPAGPVTAVTLTAPDTAAPTAPGALRVTGTTTTTIGLAWSASTDNTGVTNYLVYRNGILVASPTSLTYTDPGLTPGTTYTYHVKAIDGAGNISAAAMLPVATVAPQVSSIDAAVSLGSPPACTVTITATVAVTTGPVTVHLQVVINGVTTTTAVPFTGTGPASKAVTVGTASGAQDGTVQVSSTSPNPVGTTKTWTAPESCRPGFTVTSPTARADGCGLPTISGSVRVTTRNNPGQEQYTVQMIVDGSKVAETTISLAANSSEVVSLTSPEPYPNGVYAVSYVVTAQQGSSVSAPSGAVEVLC